MNPTEISVCQNVIDVAFVVAVAVDRVQVSVLCRFAERPVGAAMTHLVVEPANVPLEAPPVVTAWSNSVAICCVHPSPKSDYGAWVMTVFCSR